jgi:inner membrane protein
LQQPHRVHNRGHGANLAGLDPVAHTLFGAALAESGLRRRSRYATVTLLVGANLPDVDVLAGLWGDDAELHFRRGWTHGVLAMLVLPLLLALGVALWHRWRGSTRVQPDAPPYRPVNLLALAFLAVWTHPLLDWLNTYGVRLLMPFDGRWFYGDTLFIIEPWFWLLAAAGVVLARSSTRRAGAAWMVLALLASVLVLGTDVASAAVKLVWCAGIALIAALAWRRPVWAPGERLARAGLAALLLYIGVTYGLARVAEARAARRFAGVTEVQSNPVPGSPLRHRMLLVDDDRYRVVAEDGATHELLRPAPDAVVRAAMTSPSIRGFINWSRFPYWTVEEEADHWLVRIRDLRYQGPDMVNARGIGAAEVLVRKEDLPPVSED